MSETPQRVAVAICTRDRPLHLRRCLDSLAAQPLAKVELIIVIDQSENADSERIVASHILASRIQYVRQSGSGVSRARNLAARLAVDADALVFIDDDCTALQGWLDALLAPLDDQRIALVYGQVDAVEHDSRMGFVGSWAPGRPRVLHGRLGKLHDAGAMGATRAVRTRVARDLTFDEMLGPGAPLHAAEDMDFAYRVLKAGWWIAHTPDAAVLHWGFRDFHEGGRLMWNVSGGIAATYVKQIRSGDAVAVILLGHEMWRSIANVIDRVWRLKRPLGLRRVAGMIYGTVVAARAPIDARTGLYRLAGTSARGSADMPETKAIGEY